MKPKTNAEGDRAYTAAYFRKWIFIIFIPFQEETEVKLIVLCFRSQGNKEF